MKIDLNNPPKFIQCKISFYGFQKDTIYRYNKESNNYLAKDRYTYGSVVNIDLLESLKDGYFDIYIPSKDELYEIELNNTVEKLENTYTKSDSTKGMHFFKAGIEWYKSKNNLI